MKILLILLTVAIATFVQTGCSGGASVGHDGHQHGAAVSGTTQGPGAGASARVY